MRQKIDRAKKSGGITEGQYRLLMRKRPQLDDVPLIQQVEDVLSELEAFKAEHDTLGSSIGQEGGQKTRRKRERLKLTSLLRRDNCREHCVWKRWVFVIRFRMKTDACRVIIEDTFLREWMRRRWLLCWCRCRINHCNNRQDR